MSSPLTYKNKSLLMNVTKQSLCPWNNTNSILSWKTKQNLNVSLLNFGQVRTDFFCISTTPEVSTIGIILRRDSLFFTIRKACGREREQLGHLDRPHRRGRWACCWCVLWNVSDFCLHTCYGLYMTIFCQKIWVFTWIPLNWSGLAAGASSKSGTIFSRHV
jgi:hypothetical protein